MSVVAVVRAVVVAHHLLPLLLMVVVSVVDLQVQDRDIRSLPVEQVLITQSGLRDPYNPTLVWVLKVVKGLNDPDLVMAMMLTTVVSVWRVVEAVVLCNPFSI